MKIRRVAILPSLMTLGNALCGFYAITLTTKALAAGGGPDHAMDPNTLMLAGAFVILAMVFDALDGRLARLARVTSDFGGQLDSVADTVSFGVAPAYLMTWVVSESLRPEVPAAWLGLLRVTWVCAAVYLGCTLIRLARFNVENVHDEEAHLSFRGLPSPAAAGALVSLIIVLASFWRQDTHDMAGRVMVWLLPPVALALGLLMVSRIRYSHLLNQFIRGRRPLRHLVLILLCLGLAVLVREITLPIAFLGYAASGPVGAVVRRWRRRPDVPTGQPPEGPADPKA
jgi:CDP-diacylglycerol--serine O-phosphatidyltransferase